ncbi:hypothetical protein BKA61DRAFT_664767 [Leptodontidium sp. MPI-SDFR-AT-0119]|nr:hypothetical protein BKA61DRAFT_664767 [Leptodontidium sp. MPI-SDFR-AT-0119]
MSANDENKLQPDGRLEEAHSGWSHPDPVALGIYKNAIDSIDQRVLEEMMIIYERRQHEDEERENERQKEYDELRDRITKEETTAYGQAMMRYNEDLGENEVKGQHIAPDIKMASPKDEPIEEVNEWEPISKDEIEVWESLVTNQDKTHGQVFYVLRCQSCIDANETFKSKSTKIQPIIKDWGQHGRTKHPEKYGDLPDVYQHVVYAFGIWISDLTKDLYDQFKEDFKEHNGIPSSKIRRGKESTSKALCDGSKEGNGDGNEEGVSAEQADTESTAEETGGVRDPAQISKDAALAREIHNKELEESRRQEIIMSTRSMKNRSRVRQSIVAGTGTARERARKTAATSTSYAAPQVDDNDSDENYSPPSNTSPSIELSSQSPPNTASRLQQKRKQDQSSASESDSEEDGSYEYEDDEKESRRRAKSASSIPKNHNPKEPSRQEHPKRASKLQKSNERQSTTAKPGKEEDRLSKNKNAEDESRHIAKSASIIPNRDPKEPSRQEYPKQTSELQKQKEGQSITEKSDGRKHDHFENKVAEEETLFVPQGRPSTPNNYSPQNPPRPKPRALDFDRPKNQKEKPLMSKSQSKASGSPDAAKSRPYPENGKSTLRPTASKGDQRQSSATMKGSKHLPPISTTARSSASSSQARLTNKRSADASPSDSPMQKRQKPHKDSTDTKRRNDSESPIREHRTLSTREKRELDEKAEEERKELARERGKGIVDLLYGYS